MDAEASRQRCLHRQSDNDRSIWVHPSRSERVHSPAQKRPYCLDCGKVKYLGSARAKKMGFFINLLSEVQERLEVERRRKLTNHKLTQVQMRLIIKDLVEDDFFTDRWANHKFGQWEFFKLAVRRRCDVSEDLLEHVLSDFKG